jgi:hypothetical protein
LLLNRPWVTRLSGRQLALLLKLLCRVAIGGLLLLGRITVSGLLLRRSAVSGLLLLLGGIAVSGLLLVGRRILSLPLRRRDLDRDGMSWHGIPGLCFKPVILGISTTTAHNDNDQQQRSKSHTNVADVPESGRVGG